MTRVLVFCFIMLFAVGVAHAQEASAPAAPPAASEADAIWQPTVEQLAAWIGEGIATAGDDLDFFEMPVIEGMTWSSYDGVPLSGDRAIHLAALMTPELSSYIVGYGAAWEDEMWAAIVEDSEKVASGLATSLRASFSGGPMYFPIAVYGPPYADMQATVYYQGQWRSLEVRAWGALADYTSGTVGPATADPLWAARYLLTQEAAALGLQPADQVQVYLCAWARNAPTTVNTDFLAELPTPEWTDAKRARFAVGDAELLAWVDFDMIM